MYLRNAVAFLGVLATCFAPQFALSADWLPVTAEELAMTSEPKAPGAPAIYLYRQIDRNDNGPDVDVYERIKILTEAGRERANVELRYIKFTQNIRNIKARVIQPNGTIIDFDGQIDTKPLISVDGQDLMAKTFALPQTQVGCIIELRYTLLLDWRFVFDSHWVLNQDLFTRDAKFSLTPYSKFAISYSWPRGLPPGTKPPVDSHGRIELEARDVPAFVSEEFMPPEDEMKYHVDFIYSGDGFLARDTDDYWRHFGKLIFYAADSFMDEPRAMQRAVAQIIAPTEDAETKLRKIYERVQQLHNLSYEAETTKQEQERADLKPNHDVEDTWNHGYGQANDITLLYAALVRAAGIHADVIKVSTRDQYLFDKVERNASKLNSYVVLVPKADSTLDYDHYMDPGVPFTPYNYLPWSETAVAGLKLDKTGGTWLTTPVPAAFASRVERRAVLRLQADGSLTGSLAVTYRGLDAMWRRSREQNEDDTARRTFLEDEIRSLVATGSSVKLTNTPSWSSSEPTMTAEFDVSIPGWAESAGPRLLQTMGVFNNEDQHTFEHATRLLPLYFRYLYQRIDDLSVELPSGYRIEAMPAVHDSNLATMAYHIGADADGGTVHVRRSLIQNAIALPVSDYPAVRGFFQSVRAGDGQQLILSRNSGPAVH